MKTLTNLSLASLLIAFSINAYDVRGQTAEPSTPPPVKSDQGKKAVDADKAKKAVDFAAREKAMQDMSRSSASGAVATQPTTEATPYNKDRNAGKAAADEAADILTFKGSKPVDKNAKAIAPMKSLSKMTPKERDELRREVAKEAKP